MSCRDLNGRSPLSRRWHLLWCARCRVVQRTEAIIDRGVAALKSAAPPADGLALTLATVGITPASRRPRSRRWVAALRRTLLPTGMATVLLACGWFRYMDLDPQITFPAAPPPSPNAYDYYILAAQSEQNSGEMDDLLDGVREEYHAPPGARPAPRQSALFDLNRKRLCLRQNAKTLALIRQGLACAYMPPPKVRLGELLIASVFARLVTPLYLEGNVREADGDTLEAVNSYLDALQIDAEIDEEDELVQSRLWALAGRLNAVQARSAAHRLERILKLRLSLADELQAIKWARLAEELYRFHDPHWRIWTRYMNRAGAQPDIWSFDDMVAYIKTLPSSKRWIVARYIDRMDRLIAAAQRPYCQRRFLKDELAPSQSQFAIDNIFMGVWESEAENRLARAFFTTHYATQDALLLVTFALRAYRLEHGAYPATPAALAPDYLSTVPVDPFTSGLLGYRRVGAGYLLYSVGPDGKDDNGMPIDEPQPLKVPDGQIDQATFDTRGRYIITPQSKGDIVAGLNRRAGMADPSFAVGRMNPYTGPESRRSLH